MTTRRRPPVDLAAVKRSRAGCTGAITKALERFKAIPFTSSEEVTLINSKEVDRILTSINKTETNFLQSLEDAQTFVPEDAAEAFQEEEELAADTFTAAISATRDLGDQLHCIKAILNGLANFRCDSDAIQDTLISKPDSNQVSELQDLKSMFSSLRSQWQTANLPQIHPIKAELDACRKALATLAAEVTAATDKSDSHSTSSTSSGPASPCYILGKNDLPTITVPKFTGDIMDWSSFWASFKSTIEDRKELTNTQRLHYLREAIPDPELQLLLHSPAETPDFYLEVVEELKDRFQKTREIHKLLTRTLADLPSPKQTRTELRRLVDLVKRTINSLKATKHYDMDSFVSSLVVSVLPSRLQTTWAQHTMKDKGVPPISKLLLFLRDHAETLPSTGAPPPATPSEPATRKSSHRKQDFYKPQGVHSITPSTSNSYKWECILCKPDKHPLHLCPQWATLTVPQRMGHIQSKSLCSNCLAGGHSTSACKSSYRCRDCGQSHHTTIHQQQTAANRVNSSSSQSSQVPDALMTTAQVLLLGPRGQEVKARALIDSGAGLSLVSSRVANLLDLTLEPIQLQLSMAQGEQSKPLRHLTQLSISPLQNRDLKIPCRAAVTPTVTCDLPPQPVEQILDLPHIMGLQLADPDYHIPGRIDILLGAEMAPKVMTKQLMRDGLLSQPIAQSTHFGWVVSGPVARKDSTTEVKPSSYHQTPIIQSDQNTLIKPLWQSEEPEPEETSLPIIEEMVEEQCADTVKSLSTEDSQHPPGSCGPATGPQDYPHKGQPLLAQEEDQQPNSSADPHDNPAEDPAGEECHFTSHHNLSSATSLYNPAEEPAGEDSNLLDLHSPWKPQLPDSAARHLPRCHSSTLQSIKHLELPELSDDSKAASSAVLHCRTTPHDHPPTASLVTLKPSSWHSVPTAEHPADYASKRIMPQQPPKKELLEPTPPVNILTQSSTPADDIRNMSSTYSVIPSNVAWCWRFCSRPLYQGTPSPEATNHLPLVMTNHQNPVPSPMPIFTGAEGKAAGLWLLKQAQIILFSSERASIRKGRPLSKYSRLEALHPLLDYNQTLRVGGLPANSILYPLQQHPTTADAKDHFIHKWFRHLHLTLCHCGPSLLLCTTGAKFPMLSARRLSRAVYSRCVPCRRKQPHLHHQLMGGLTAPKNNTTTPSVLSRAERRAAEIWLLKQAQIRLFSAERLASLKGRPLSRSSKLKSLHPLLDHNQLYRIGGRLPNFSLPHSQQHPLTADVRNPFIQKHFKHLHTREQSLGSPFSSDPTNPFQQGPTRKQSPGSPSSSDLLRTTSQKIHLSNNLLFKSLSLFPRECVQSWMTLHWTTHQQQQPCPSHLELSSLTLLESTD